MSFFPHFFVISFDLKESIIDYNCSSILNLRLILMLIRFFRDSFLAQLNFFKICILLIRLVARSDIMFLFAHTVIIFSLRPTIFIFFHLFNPIFDVKFMLQCKIMLQCEEMKTIFFLLTNNHSFSQFSYSAHKNKNNKILLS